MTPRIAQYDAQELDAAMARVPGGRTVYGLTDAQKLEWAQQTDVHPDMLWAVELWVDGPTLQCHYRTKGIEANPVTFCFKNFSPFFTSQERRVQCVLDADKLIHCDTLPLAEADHSGTHGWSVGEVTPPARFAMVSLDGKAKIVLPERRAKVGGNAFYPCIHVNAADNTATEGSGSFSFLIE
jgi:hypothetical protein